MSLNPFSPSSSAAAAAAAASAAAVSPDAKLTFNINAFNGNTTNFNRCRGPSAKAVITPVQPHGFPSRQTVLRPGMMTPM
jgi:hypothetical protein